MNIDKLKQQRDELTAEIERLEAVLVLNGRASLSHPYRFGGPDGCVFSAREDGLLCDSHHYDCGNYFLKARHAESRSKINAVWGQFIRVGIELADGWEPDWSDRNQKKHLVQYGHNTGKFVTDHAWSDHVPMGLYQETLELAQQHADWANNNEQLMGYMK